MKNKLTYLLRRATGADGPTDPRPADLARPLQLLLSLAYRDLARRAGERPSFDEVGFNIYSPTYEDGILLYIFSVIGLESRRVVDIGAGGIEASNVANLILHHGCDGLLIDADTESIARARAQYAGHPETRIFAPTLVAARVTVDDVDDLLRQHGFAGELDLLCIDVDGVDYWIWKAIEAAHPRVVLVEYQDILGPDRCWTIPYQPDFCARDHAVNREHNNYCGASLAAFVKLGKQKGYRLVGCNRGGYNAFFVRDGIGEEHLPEVSAASCFRYRWNRFGIEQRFPLVAHLPWQEV